MTSPADDPMLERLRRVRAEIDDAAVSSGRSPSDVRLLLATKTQPAERISLALAAGYTLIGENRVQEVVAKADALATIPHEIHFIGHLQANKVNQLLGRISCLQTLDSVELARKLDARLDVRDEQLDVLIQVNVSGEPTKSGVAPERRAGSGRGGRRHPAADRPRIHDDRAELAGPGRGPCRVPDARRAAGRRDRRSGAGGGPRRPSCRWG